MNNDSFTSKLPLVSIVVPCFNGERYLDTFFHSILNQIYPNIELIFVDDGSTDNSRKLAESFRIILEQNGIRVVLLSQNNAGQAAALNRGLKHVNGEYLNWMDCDDEILPEFISAKVEYLLKHQESVFCYGKAIFVNEESPGLIVKEMGRRKTDNRLHGFFEDILFPQNVFFSGYLVKMDALDKVLPNREIYTGRGGQNAQLLLPLAWTYGEPDYVEQSIYKYYLRSNSHSHSALSSDEKAIQQLYNYERILVETIKRIPDHEPQKYIPLIRKRMARLRFGHSLNSKNQEIINHYVEELKQVNEYTLHDRYMVFRYTSKVLNSVLPVD